MNSPETPGSDSDRYWKQCLNVVYIILGIWAFISLGCGVLFREFLDKTMPNVGHAPFGFWMAQQGAIIGFLILLFVYMIAMNGIDRRHGFGKDDE
jgi:putative solute:sodium symporter small subunit